DRSKGCLTCYITGGNILDDAAHDDMINLSSLNQRALQESFYSQPAQIVRHQIFITGARALKRNSSPINKNGILGCVCRLGRVDHRLGDYVLNHVRCINVYLLEVLWYYIC